ncbi:MarR family winged helix-turn-helix transcriptional regulator [Campylobacterota bacterium DY0563]
MYNLRMKIEELDKDLNKIKEKTPHLYSDIFYVSVPFHQFYKKLLGDADSVLKSNYGISSIELDALACLYYSGGDDYILSPKSLSGRLLFSSSSLAKLLKRLEKMGCLIRVPNEDDKRSTLVQLTKKGEDILLKGSLDIKESDEKSFESLNEEDFESLKNILFKLNRK